MMLRRQKKAKSVADANSADRKSGSEVAPVPSFCGGAKLSTQQHQRHDYTSTMPSGRTDSPVSSHPVHQASIWAQSNKAWGRGRLQSGWDILAEDAGICAFSTSPSSPFLRPSGEDAQNKASFMDLADTASDAWWLGHTCSESSPISDISECPYAWWCSGFRKTDPSPMSSTISEAWWSQPSIGRLTSPFSRSTMTSPETVLVEVSGEEPCLRSVSVLSVKDTIHPPMYSSLQLEPTVVAVETSMFEIEAETEGESSLKE